MHKIIFRGISILYQVCDFDLVDRLCNGDLKPLLKGKDMCGSDKILIRSFKCYT